MWNQFLNSLEIMGKGMFGIFTAILIIMFSVMIMGKIAGKETKKDDKKES